MAEHGTPDLSSSQAPFIQALVQKSVTAITKLAGRLSFGMLSESRCPAQEHQAKNPRKTDHTLGLQLTKCLLRQCPLGWDPDSAPEGD